MLKALILAIGLGAGALAAAPAVAQTAPASGAAPHIPNRADASGTWRRREHHRNTLNRQKARATSAHARQVRETRGQ